MACRCGRSAGKRPRCWSGSLARGARRRWPPMAHRQSAAEGPLARVLVSDAVAVPVLVLAAVSIPVQRAGGAAGGLAGGPAAGGVAGSVAAAHVDDGCILLLF